jgi:hypothetical protein
MITLNLPVISAVSGVSRAEAFIQQSTEVVEERLLDLASIIAVVVGAATYALTALQLWWDDNGEEVKAACVRSYEGVRAALPVIRSEALELGRDARTGWTVAKVAISPVLRRLQAL